jgi:hypothetical protein
MLNDDWRGDMHLLLHTSGIEERDKDVTGRSPRAHVRAKEYNRLRDRCSVTASSPFSTESIHFACRPACCDPVMLDTEAAGSVSAWEVLQFSGVMR